MIFLPDEVHEDRLTEAAGRHDGGGVTSCGGRREHDGGGSPAVGGEGGMTVRDHQLWGRRGHDRRGSNAGGKDGP